jgi:hypothetical protein
MLFTIAMIAVWIHFVMIILLVSYGEYEKSVTPEVVKSDAHKYLADMLWKIDNRPAPSRSGSALDSGIIAAVTDSTILGAVIGGDIVGAVIGDSLDGDLLD